MRFVKGDNLKEAIRRFHEAEKPGRDPGERSLALRDLLRRFVDVCNAVAYAHSRGVLHRDLKPGNIMLGKYGETLIVDWGLAKSIGRSDGTRTTEESTWQPSSGSDWAATVMGTVIGTPAYMSPEQAAGWLDLLGPASDIYSLGATLYALLTGTAPFDESDKVELLQQVQRGAWLTPRQVKANTPAALDAICRKAMAPKPQDRYVTALALAADVEHWLADEPVTAYREPWTVRSGRWLRRHEPRSPRDAGPEAAVVTWPCRAWCSCPDRAASRDHRNIPRFGLTR
jgi:serine/threonine-protein kinase